MTTIISTKECGFCHRVFPKPYALSRKSWTTHRFCSRSCAGRSRGNLAPKSCPHCGSEFSRRETERANEWNRRQFCSRACRYGVTRGVPKSPETREKMGAWQRGSKHYNWRGGITPENKRIRNGAEMQAWRKSVFDRDDFTCQMCGSRGGKLQADHILPFSLYPHLRFELTNGRTLCVPCHKKTPTYGRAFTRFAQVAA